MNASPRSLVVALTLVALLVFSPTWLYGQSSVSVERIDNGLQVKFGDEVFTNFLYMDYDKPILYPIFAPGSVAITRSFPMDESVSGDAHDHPHHKSFWLAHGDVNGFDFWSEKAAIHCFQVDLQDDGFVAHNEWMGQGKILVTETSEYKFEDKGECRLITVDTKLECGEDVDEAVFGDTKEGFFALRTHPNLRLTNSPGNGVTTANGQALNSNGDKNRDLWERPLNGCTIGATLIRQHWVSPSWIIRTIFVIRRRGMLATMGWSPLIHLAFTTF